jgi:nucleoside-diphosphate-sugar epimerase
VFSVPALLCPDPPNVKECSSPRSCDQKREETVIANRQIALTGATGFIGRFVVHELTRRGHRIRVLLRQPRAIPAASASAVIGDIRRPQNMAAALADVDAVIHMAGAGHAMTGLPEDDYRLLDTAASLDLAAAARRAGVRRFMFLSSIRAQAGPSAPDPLREDARADPVDAYGRSKLAAEEGLARLDLDWVALRLALVYGPGAGGNIARLAKLARSNYPLPLASLTARRSLLSLDNLAGALDCLLRHDGELRTIVNVADPDPETVPAIIAAMRRGLGRRPGVFACPKPVFRALCRASGHREAYRLMAEPLVVDIGKLTRLGGAGLPLRLGLEAYMRETDELTPIKPIGGAVP